MRSVAVFTALIALHLNWTQAQGTCTYGAVRLVGGTFEGRVEICINNVWGTVCDDLWTNINAQVVCRQLGHSTHVNYIGALYRSSAYYGQGNGSILLDDVQCTGTEDTLLECSHDPIGSHTCSHSDDVGVICLGSSIPFGTVILSRNNVSSNSFSYGTIRVHGGSGRWGNICDDFSYGGLEADVICHQLGYTGASSYPRAGLVNYGTDTLPIIWDDVDCSSSSYLSITQCSYTTDIDSGCINSNSYDATVSCYTTRIWDSNPFPGMIRLQRGAYSNQGLVEVYCNGRWGTVCNSGFGDTDAATLCRQLGFQTYQYNLLALTGNSSQSIWVTNMNSGSTDQCFNTANTCPGSAVTSCPHARDVTLSCGGDISSSSRLSVTATTCRNTATGNSSTGTSVGTTVTVIVVVIVMMIIIVASTSYRRRRRRAFLANRRSPCVNTAVTETSCTVTTDVTVQSPPPSYSQEKPPSYPIQATAYPAQGTGAQYPSQGQSYPTAPYPSEAPPSYPAQNEAYPTGQPYPTQGQPYPTQGQPYPTQGQPYPTQAQPYPQGQPYPVQPVQYPAYPPAPESAGVPYPVQTGYPDPSYPPQHVGLPYPPQEQVPPPYVAQ